MTHEHPGGVTEVVCEQCGARSLDTESFCGNCGAYLVWEGRPAVRPVEPEQSEPPEEAPVEEVADRKGVVQRVREAVGGAAADAESVPAAPDRPAPSPAPPDAPPEATVDLPPAAPPGPVLPGERIVRPQPTTRHSEAERPAPGDLICGACGTGNIPSRKFCRRCGEALADAAVATRPPWWRRLFSHQSRGAPVAGTRPRRRNRGRRLRRLLVPVLVVGLVASAAWYARDDLRHLGTLARDRFRNVVPVDPDAVTATSSARGRRPGRLVDGLADRYWAPARPGPGTGQAVRFSFAQPIDLRYINIAAGASGERDEFLTRARPATLLLRIKTAAGETRVREVSLKDKPGPQRFAIRVDEVVATRMEITSAAGVRPGRRVAIAEVEFFRQA